MGTRIALRIEVQAQCIAIAALSNGFIGCDDS
jgi:hypothetical protein